jgi:CHAD domain-containing protein
MNHILFYYTDSAVRMLQRANNIHENIHQARLCFKRSRSLLRLGRTGLGEDKYKELNTFYRDQARLLSHLRDTTALIELSQELKSSRRSSKVKTFLGQFRNQLLRQRKELMNNPEIETERLNVIHALNIQKELIHQIEYSGNMSFVFSKGVQRIYNRGKRLYKLTQQETSDHNMHEWRKQVKYLWYQVVFITPLWPPVLTTLGKQLQTLSQLLGKHHDFVLLETWLDPMKKELKFKNQVMVLEKSINRNKKSLEEQALKLGSKLYLLSASQTKSIIQNMFAIQA